MKKLALLISALCMATATWASDFTSGGINYTITSSTAPYTVKVAGCDEGLTTLTIPTSVDNGGTTYAVTSIADGAFFLKGLLFWISIPSSVTSMGSQAFYYSGLKSIDIQASITSIEPYTFWSCFNLKSITIPSTVKMVGEGAFWNCGKLDTVRVPASVDSIYFNAFMGDTSLTAIRVDAANANYTDVDGVLYNKDQTKLVCYPAGKTASSYTIPSTVTCIDSAAFDSCRLSSVVIPASVVGIGKYAFWGSSKLSSIYAYPVTPVSVGENTFYGVDTAQCVLHVPVASLAAYKSADVWKSFKYIEGDLTAGLPSISADVKITVANGELQLAGLAAGQSLSVYNAAGTPVYSGKTTGTTQRIGLPAHGVYIVQLNNASRKLIY